MVMGALEKLIRGTAWPALDLLLIDMPPGAPLPRACALKLRAALRSR
jgi:Mrp family chromosome partitioning ATPase